jgi:hypothetical protein
MLITRTQADRHIQVSWVTIVLYNLSLPCTKLSILLLYIRVLTYENFRRVAWGVLAMIAIFSIGFLVALMTACIPLRKYWDPSVDGTCLPVSVWWAGTGFNVGSDFLLVLLPLPVIFSLTLPPRQKLALVFVFVLGLL